MRRRELKSHNSITVAATSELVHYHLGCHFKAVNWADLTNHKCQNMPQPSLFNVTTAGIGIIVRDFHITSSSAVVDYPIDGSFLACITPSH